MLFLHVFIHHRPKFIVFKSNQFKYSGKTVKNCENNNSKNHVKKGHNPKFKKVNHNILYFYVYTVVFKRRIKRPLLGLITSKTHVQYTIKTVLTVKLPRRLRLYRI